MTPIEKYQLVKKTRVCPDCGHSVVLLPIKDIAPTAGSADRVGLRCSGADPGQRDGKCKYWIDGGESLSDFPKENVITAFTADFTGIVRPRADGMDGKVTSRYEMPKADER